MKRVRWCDSTLLNKMMMLLLMMMMMMIIIIIIINTTTIIIIIIVVVTYHVTYRLLIFQYMKSKVEIPAGKSPLVWPVGSFFSTLSILSGILNIQTNMRMAINDQRRKKKKYEGLATNFKEIRHYFSRRHKIRVWSSWTTAWESNLEHLQLQLLDCSVLFWTKTRR